MSNDTTHNQSQSSTARAAERPTGSIQVTRTELVWPGKYNDDGTRKEVPRVSLPFQVIETVNESQATRQAKKAAGATLFDLYEGDEGDTFDTGWQNKLIWGDNLLVMGSLLEKFAGKIDLILHRPAFCNRRRFLIHSRNWRRRCRCAQRAILAGREGIPRHMGARPYFLPRHDVRSS